VEALEAQATPVRGPEARPSPARFGGRFFGRPDRPIREALAQQPIASVTRGHGGRSLGFRITFADGYRAYFKPAQSFNGMAWSSEVAAYHLDRALGLGRVAPSVGRRIPWSALSEAAGHDARMSEIEVADDGTVVGAMIYWVPQTLRPLELPDGWERWVRIDDALPRVSPFQRPGRYRRAVASGAPAREVPEPPRPDRPTRPGELSDMIVFDYLTQNADRWGNHNTNVRTLGRGGALMYLDNGAGFVLRRARTSILDARLAQVQRFRRSTIDAIRGLRRPQLERRLDSEPVGPLLDERQVDHLFVRRAHLLEYVDGLVHELGEDRVYSL